MMLRKPILVAAALTVIASVGPGCGEKCKNETPAVSQNGLPTCGVLQAGAQVSVDVHVCPSCSNTPTCAVDASQVSSGVVFLEPQAEVCQDTCPIENPAACPFQPVTCTFIAPTGVGQYNIYVADPNSSNGHQVIPFTVGSSGATSCTFGT